MKTRFLVLGLPILAPLCQAADAPPAPAAPTAVKQTEAVKSRATPWPLLSEAGLSARQTAGEHEAWMEHARRVRQRARMAASAERANTLKTEAGVAVQHALAACRRAAEAGDADAAYALAMMIPIGDDATRAKTERNTWIKRAADAGSPAACIDMGLSAEQDALQQLADQSGEAIRQAMDGVVISSDMTPAEAAKLKADHAVFELRTQNDLSRWKLAAEQGDVDAQVEYALLLLKQEAGAVRDRSNRTVFKAWKLLENAAKQNRVRAMHALWPLYMTSFCDIPKHPEEAYRLARLASDLGYGPAHAWLHQRFATGDHWAANPAEAARYQKLAAEAGCAPVTVDGARLAFAPDISPSTDGIPAPYAPRDAWLDRAAAACAARLKRGLPVGASDAMWLVQFRNRIWVKALSELYPEIANAAACGDWDRLRHLAEIRIADTGNADALGRLAYETMRGNGVKQDFARAQALATRAAELGGTLGMIDLGIMAKKGYGCEPSAVEAAKWWLLAWHHCGEMTPAEVRGKLTVPVDDTEFAEASRRAERWMAAHTAE